MCREDVEMGVFGQLVHLSLWELILSLLPQKQSIALSWLLLYSVPPLRSRVVHRWRAHFFFFFYIFLTLAYNLTLSSFAMLKTSFRPHIWVSWGLDVWKLLEPQAELAPSNVSNQIWCFSLATPRQGLMTSSLRPRAWERDRDTRTKHSWIWMPSCSLLSEAYLCLEQVT